jgi:hypothetical protein
MSDLYTVMQVFLLIKSIFHQVKGVRLYAYHRGEGAGEIWGSIFFRGAKVSNSFFQNEETPIYDPKKVLHYIIVASMIFFQLHIIAIFIPE